MNVLVACEESQAVATAFRENGHNAYSCDIIPCSGNHSEYHIIHDVIPLLNGNCVFLTQNGNYHEIKGRWDMIIGFPPCTYLSITSAARMTIKGEINQQRYEKAIEAKEFFMNILNADCEKIAVENPTPLKLVKLPEYSQAIQPWQFGHPYTKRTCLWLKNLPLLKPTNIYNGETTPWVNAGNRDKNGEYRKKKGPTTRDPRQRAKTFPGIAKAMADQWGGKI